MTIDEIKVLLKARMDSANANAEHLEQKAKMSENHRRNYQSAADAYQKLADELRDILRAIDNNGQFRNMSFSELTGRNFTENPDY